MTNTNLQDTKDLSFAGHQRWGGTYLIVADGSEEFDVALCYAARMANANKCRVGVFYAIENQGFVHWGNIEKRMHDDQRNEAEKVVQAACIEIEDRGGAIPSIYIEEGSRLETLATVIENDDKISMLILAAGTNSNNPGPLVSYFTGKGLSRLRVPVMVVPEHLEF